MISFYYLTQYNRFSYGFIALKYFLWSVFFVLQAHAVELILMHRKNIFPQLIETLGLYVVMKVMVMLCDVGQEFIGEVIKNKEMNQQWNGLFPTTLYADNVIKKNEFKRLMFDYIPDMFVYNHLIASNRFMIMYIVLFVIVYFIVTKFYVGLLMLSVLFFLNGFSKTLWVDKIDRQQKKNHALRHSLIHWCDQYFDGYKEFSSNWAPEVYSTWHRQMYSPVYDNQQALSRYCAFRDLVCQALVELPFVMNTALILFMVYREVISVGVLFVWMGMSTFVITASNAIAKNKVLIRQLAVVRGLAEELMDIFTQEGRDFEAQPLIKSQKIIEDKVACNVILHDGSAHGLSLLPNLYHIKGNNGAGKTTLLDILKGFNRSSVTPYAPQLLPLLTHLNKTSIRVVERRAIIFDELKDFSSQVMGPGYTPDAHALRCLEQKLKPLIPEAYLAQWLAIFKVLQQKYDAQPYYELSSGEHVLLSFARMCSHWNSGVRLVLVDECDGFLDSLKWQSFIDTMIFLSKKVSVFVVSHDAMYH